MHPIPRRARVLTIAAGFLCGLCLLGHAEAQQPNIVLIVVDDAGFADFGFMGSTEIPTPNLDALAANGVVFNQAHTGQACSPSRAALLTGVDHNRWGYEANLKNTDDPLTEHFEGLPNAAVTMFERLKTLGYSTSVAGKWHVGGLDDVVQNGVITTPGNKPPKQGVDHFTGFQAGGGLQRMFLNPDGTNNVTNFSTGQAWSDLWGDTTIDYIDDHYQDANPFFVYSSFNDPHAPITEAPSFNDPRIAGLSGQRKRYASEILTVDDNVGRIVQKLQDPNGDGNQADSIMDETMIVFMNDNGGVLGNSADNGSLRDGKGSPYDGGTRVPMFISGAGIDPAAKGTTYEKLVHSIDIVPTMVAAAGGTIPANQVDGVNLLPFANGADSSNPHTSIAQRVQEEIFYRTNDWKLVKNGYAGEWELYDFSDINNQSEDPADDVADSNPTVLAQMIRGLTDWEVTIDKQRFPSTDENISQFNLFDHFTHSGNSGNFSTANAWQGPSGASATMRDRDSHNGTVFHFGTSDSSSYTAINDLRRMNELEFVANGFEFEGEFSGVTDQQATVTGLPVLLAKNLQGALPAIKLDATQGAAASSAGAQFTHQLAAPVLLYDDLEIQGDGDGHFVVSGDVTEYRAGRTITKTGQSTVHFAGAVEATAGVFVDEGTVVVEAASTVTGDLHIASTGQLQVDGVVAGNVTNAGAFVVSALTGGGVTTTVNLLPALGDGDLDSRNSSTKGDQDTEILVGSVSNATSTLPERVQRALLSFDLSSLPDAAQVISTALTLQLNGNDSGSSNDVSGDLVVNELTSDPVFSETGAENVDWLQRDASGGQAWGTPGGDLGSVLATLANASLPDPRFTSAQQTLSPSSLAAFITAVQNNLVDDVLSLAISLPGEEADAAAMTGNRDLYRIGSNESTASSPASLEITYMTSADTQADITGDFVQQSSGSILFDLRSDQSFDSLMIAGAATLDGDLIVNLADGFVPSGGDSFLLLDANSLSGQFANASNGQRVVVADGSGSFLVQYDNLTGGLTLASFLPTIAGDFNADGFVDGADYALWRNTLGSTQNLAADADNSGQVDEADLVIWRNNFGVSAPGAAGSVNVPEPTTAVVLAAYAALFTLCRGKTLRGK